MKASYTKLEWVVEENEGACDERRERSVCELNYKSYIEYMTEMIMKTAIVYVVGPRNMFVVHYREVQGGDEIARRGEH